MTISSPSPASPAPAPAVDAADVLSRKRAARVELLHVLDAHARALEDAADRVLEASAAARAAEEFCDGKLYALGAARQVLTHLRAGLQRNEQDLRRAHAYLRVVHIDTARRADDLRKLGQ